MVLAEDIKTTVYFSDLLALAYPRLWGRICDAMATYGFHGTRKTLAVTQTAYVNLLRTKDFILVPGLGTDSDSEALKQIEQLYPNYEGRIQQVNIAPIVEKYGGAFNCLTWTVKIEK